VKFGSGEGEVNITPGWTNIVPGFLRVFDLNTEVSLTAVPDNESVFMGWSGDVHDSTGTIVITLDTSKFIVAHFALKNVTSAHASQTESIVQEYSLSQNYPNPFNPTTVISYQLPVASNVLLAVYDVLGREVAMLVREKQSAGEYSVTWNAASISSGVFFYRLQAGAYSATKKLVKLK
jgi:hypothetical protein